MDGSRRSNGRVRRCAGRAVWKHEQPQSLEGRRRGETRDGFFLREAAARGPRAPGLFDDVIDRLGAEMRRREK